MDDSPLPFFVDPDRGVPSTRADALAARIGAKRIDVGALCKSEGFHGAYDEALDTHELDEDALLDEMEARLEAHGERGEACVVEPTMERQMSWVIMLLKMSLTYEIYMRPCCTSSGSIIANSA